MRKFFSIVLFLLAATVAMSQDTVSEKYLLKNSKVVVSGFGGVMSETSQLNHNISDCIGAGGALSINQYFFIGAYGLSLTSKHNINDLVMHNNYADSSFYGQKLRTNFTHAGIWTGFIFFPKKAVHLGINTRIGWGSIRLVKADVAYVNNVNYLLDYMHDKVFVITPQVDVEVAITSWLKCSLGVGYRFVQGVDFLRYKDFNFNTPQITVGVCFGGFFSKEDNAETPTIEEEKE